MYSSLIKTMQNPPRLYETTGIPFWDDEHISKSMLNAHLTPESDGASRNHVFIKESVEWMSSLPAPGMRLLDLGCGPGLYAEALCRRGYRVTGIDFSKRSIEYAGQSALRAGLEIDYAYQDYLTIDFNNDFDMAMLIYCDFGVLPPGTRKSLLEKIYAAIRPGGLFLVDTFTPLQYRDFTDKITAEFEETGFWRAAPYLCIKREKRYEGNHFLEQYIIITEDEQQTYNLWNHAFSQQELQHDLKSAGFDDIEFYGDAGGNPINQDSPTICAVCKKL